MGTVQKMVALKNLRFDPENPRLPAVLQGINDVTTIINYMLRDGNLMELMQSIAELGFSDAEPLLVCPASEDDCYTVVEGNRRLAALILLENPALATVRKSSVEDIFSQKKYTPTEIPVIAYEKRADILDYLGYRHITGIKEWGPTEKATYIDQLYQRHKGNEDPEGAYRSIAKMIGSRADYVRKLHLSFALHRYANDKAYFELPISDEDISFSWLSTAISYGSIFRYISKDADSELTADLENIDEEHFENLFKWLFDSKNRKITESRELSNLSKVIECDRAVEMLAKGRSIQEALVYTSAPSDAFLSFLVDAKGKLMGAKNSVEQLSEVPEGANDILDDIRKLCNTITGALQANYQSPESSKGDVLSSLSKEDIEKLAAMIQGQGR